jgi:ABC-type uncharacterized transport system auxiliary subunit
MRLEEDLRPEAKNKQLICPGKSAKRAAHSRQFLVKMKTVRIFNRVFEVRESAQKAENLAGIGAFGTAISALTMSVLTIVGPYAKLGIC